MESGGVVFDLDGDGGRGEINKARKCELVGEMDLGGGGGLGEGGRTHGGGHQRGDRTSTALDRPPSRTKDGLRRPLAPGWSIVC